MGYRIDSKHARRQLESRTSPYWKQIDPGFSIGYRKNKNTGTWFARRYATSEYTIRRLGAADDNQPANGIDVLSFKQARKKGSDYEDVLETLEQPRHPALFTVAKAVADYLEWYQANKKAYERTKGVCHAHILPKLGNVPVARLTTPQIDKWLQTLATSPARTAKGNPKPPYAVERDSGKRTPRKDLVIYELVALPYDEWTDDMKRKRKSTANRVLTVLKAALNRAWKYGNAKNREEWQKVEPFVDVDAARVVHLSEDQARDLLAAASDDFQPMARAALLTGCRYGELTRLKVSDLTASQLSIKITKTGKPRDVPLSAEGQKFFKSLAKDKQSNDLLLTHSDGSKWDRSHQTRPMREACQKAGISPPVGIHALRHSYATLLLRTDGDSAGLSIRYVAELIGDSVATTSKHYGHVIQDDLRKEVARKLPSFGGAL